MYHLKSAQIKGFWGTRNIELQFNSHSNFLIGINGSGKTTLVNLIVSCLEADFEHLMLAEFSEIIISLRAEKTNRIASLKITKIEEQISFFFKENSKDNYQSILNDEINEFHRYSSHFRNDFRRRNIFKNRTQLANLFNISWLSVHRTKTDYREIREKYDSSIDLKLYELSNELVRLFSYYNQKISEQIDQFQKQVFLSLLYKRENKHSVIDSFLKLDSKKEKEALENIYKNFNLDSTDLKSKISNHFSALDKAQQKLKNTDNHQGIDLNDFSVLFSTERIDFIVEKWNDHLVQKSKIEEPKDKFLNILNSMMQRKRFYINARNELEVVTQSQKPLSLNQLSSGEKQLLIILGEAFLQQNKRFIYFADEPELSLHINWQEHLVQHLKELNPNAQIIFATHSPDIVSCFGENIINMETIITNAEVSLGE
ncbi:AAA family ATPase [Acinetobacter baumannii]|uniref:AAA family ATPase n=1 Tax=Acinetobacter baumannii TaxID=470 RepID=UPI00234080CC|nr:ATP-binding protein [Acinetobacter baumannii]MDV7383595.1 AAA family ATPase [Acinetobacter baumannii]